MFAVLALLFFCWGGLICDFSWYHFLPFLTLMNQESEVLCSDMSSVFAQSKQTTKFLEC